MTDGSLVQCVRDVRGALGEAGDLCVRTVKKKGYIFDPPPRVWSEQVDLLHLTVEEEEKDVRAGGDVGSASPQSAVTVQHEPASEPDGGARGRAALAAPRAAGGVRRHRRAALVVLATLALAAAAAALYFAARPPAIRSVAVLPFVNEGGNEEVEYLSDGVAESLINSLSQLPGLKVIARGSSFRYRGRGRTRERRRAPWASRPY